jgi:hypothetical protein
LSILTSPEAWQEIATEWDAAALEANAFYLSYSWLHPWWEAFGRLPLELGIVWSGHRVIAIAPFCRARVWRWGLPVVVVSNLFNAHLARSDVALLEDERRSLRSLLDDMDRQPWDLLFLREIPSRSRCLLELRELSRERGLRLYSQPSLDSPYINIEGTWESFERGLSQRFRKSLRNKINRLEAARVEVRFNSFSGVSEVEGILPDVMRLASESWSGQRGSSIASPANRRFYEPMMRMMAARGALKVWTLHLDDCLASFEIHVACGRTVAAVKASYSPRWAWFSPGSVLEAHVVEELFRSAQFSRYDLLGKNDFYKRRWTRELETHEEVFVFNERPLSRALEAIEFRLRPRLGAAKRRLWRMQSRFGS